MGITLTCIQPSYLPWKGYFHLIQKADIFVFHNDLQYTKQDWRNRNKIKTESGTIWITVPINYINVHQRINETKIDNTQKWRQAHWNKLQANYHRAPFWQDYASFFEHIFSSTWEMLEYLDIYSTKKICEYLGIGTDMICSSDLELKGQKTERLIDMCKKVGATHYISGPAAKAYIEEEKFSAAGISLEYMDYVYPAYPQLWGDFIHEVSIVDMLFNVGPRTGEYIWKT